MKASAARELNPANRGLITRGEPLLSHAEVIEAVRRRSRRSANLVHIEMAQGLESLASIASTAPLIGLLGTVLGFVRAFPGCSGEWSGCMAAVFERLAEVLAPGALGLFVGVVALWCFKYSDSRMEAFDLEMENATAELLSHLSIHLKRRNRSQLR
jgi:biopolymer transport protein ExbB